MKKIFLMLAAATFFMASCGENKEATAADATKAETPATDNKTVETAAATSTTGVPKFSNPDVQKVAEEYTVFMKENMAAAKSGDAAKIKELSAKATEWSTKTAAQLSKMTPEDAKIWTDYFTKLTTDLAK